MLIPHVKKGATKEYFIKFKGSSYLPRRILITKVFVDEKNPQNSFMEGHYIGDDPFCAKLHDIEKLYEPVSNVEMFTMWTNWQSMMRIDLDEAEKVRLQIVNTLKKRSYVQYGAGKFEAYDYAKMYAIRTDIKSENFAFEIGKSYETNEGKIVKVLGRTETIGYECLICDDGAYRYDRSTELPHYSDKGRGTGTSAELMDPRNFVHSLYGNRYILAKEYCDKHNVDFAELSAGGLDNNVRKLLLSYKDYLTTIDKKLVWEELL